MSTEPTSNDSSIQKEYSPRVTPEISPRVTPEHTGVYSPGAPFDDSATKTRREPGAKIYKD